MNQFLQSISLLWVMVQFAAGALCAGLIAYVLVILWKTYYGRVKLAYHRRQCRRGHHRWFDPYFRGEEKTMCSVCFKERPNG